ncbi:hypothetical protein Hanom_Chr15g01371601 [Helianthus anomalus]
MSDWYPDSVGRVSGQVDGSLSPEKLSSGNNQNANGLHGLEKENQTASKDDGRSVEDTEVTRGEPFISSKPNVNIMGNDVTDSLSNIKEPPFPTSGSQVLNKYDNPAIKGIVYFNSLDHSGRP